MVRVGLKEDEGKSRVTIPASITSKIYANFG